MPDECADRLRHAHEFGQRRRRRGEARTRVVIALTVAAMAVEVTAGIAYGSMALLADGLHMASHAAALGVAAWAYAHARRHAGDARYCFGTGKVNALGGFAGAILLAVFAVVMAAESVGRLLAPVPIDFDAALAVAAAGLGVNALSAWILGGRHAEEEAGGAPDHNLRAARLHVLADALTSVGALVALAAGRFLGWAWTDPAMGVLGALLVGRWSWGLLARTAAVLLDRQAPPEALEALRRAVEAGGEDRLADLHLWEIGPGIRAAALTVLSHDPRSPDAYRARIPPELGVVHATVEVAACAHPPAPRGPNR